MTTAYTTTGFPTITAKVEPEGITTCLLSSNCAPDGIVGDGAEDSEGPQLIEAVPLIGVGVPVAPTGMADTATAHVPVVVGVKVNVYAPL